jgi:hypothetical protein
LREQHQTCSQYHAAATTTTITYSSTRPMEDFLSGVAKGCNGMTS